MLLTRLKRFGYQSYKVSISIHVEFSRHHAAPASTFGVPHVRVDGDPGVVTVVDGELSLIMAFELAPSGIQGVRSMLNPRKLDHLRSYPPPPQYPSWKDMRPSPEAGSPQRTHRFDVGMNRLHNHQAVKKR